jgi:hypothetical protein
LSIEIQREFHCVIGEHYPWPIVGYAWARERALTTYRHALETAQTNDAKVMEI